MPWLSGTVASFCLSRLGGNSVNAGISYSHYITAMLLKANEVTGGAGR